MNKTLIEKLLNRLTLKELFDEIKSDNGAMLLIVDYFKEKNPKILINLIREFIDNCAAGNDEKLQLILKQAIIEMDSPGGVSINKISKNKTAKSAGMIVENVRPIRHVVSKKEDVDPCVSGRGGRPSC